MMPALHNAEWLQPAQGRSLECFAVKIGMYEADIVRQAFDRVLIEQIGERAAFLDRARGGGKAGVTDRIAFRRHGGELFPQMQIARTK